ncbi:hypothetical protein, partial [Paenibacillus sp. AR247]|uniref:hypothetical protein n=1 Tax=Paenibacillus sp. AR247 TaxID=1631599 RepID=UPI001C611F90
VRDLFNLSYSLSKSLVAVVFVFELPLCAGRCSRDGRGCVFLNNFVLIVTKVGRKMSRKVITD